MLSLIHSSHSYGTSSHVFWVIPIYVFVSALVSPLLCTDNSLSDSSYGFSSTGITHTFFDSGERDGSVGNKVSSEAGIGEETTGDKVGLVRTDCLGDGCSDSSSDFKEMDEDDCSSSEVTTELPIRSGLGTLIV